MRILKNKRFRSIRYIYIYILIHDPALNVSHETVEQPRSISTVYVLQEKKCRAISRVYAKVYFALFTDL